MTATLTASAQPGTMSPKRRARLARTLFVLSALTLMLSAILFSQNGALATDEAVSSKTAFNYVSVMPGDTLWELADTYSAGMNKQDWIAEVILLNNLSSATLSTGDKLALP
ncbi:MAG: hypothetical protein RLZZ610_181 [Actinomycetota bacterium]|jgi:hypothetical protein